MYKYRESERIRILELEREIKKLKRKRRAVGSCLLSSNKYSVLST